MDDWKLVMARKRKCERRVLASKHNVEICNEHAQCEGKPICINKIYKSITCRSGTACVFYGLSLIHI